MRRAAKVVLEDQERELLERIVRSPTSALREVRRARVVLLAAEGLANDRIAERLEMGVNTVGRWRRRFNDERVDGLLHDRPGRGRKPEIAREKIDEVVKKRKQSPHILEMKAGSGLVEEIQRRPPPNPGQFHGQLQTLGFTPRKRSRSLSQLKISQSHRLHGLQRCDDPGAIPEKSHGFAYI